MNKKSLIITFLTTLTGFFLVTPVSAKALNIPNPFKRAEERVEARLENEATGSGVKERNENRVEERLQKFIDKRAVLGIGEVTAIDGVNLTVVKDGKTYTVITSEATRYSRKYWGGSDFEEIKVGHMILVIGKWADEEKTTVNALMIRNFSISKRYGVVFGNVNLMGDGTITITTVKGGKAIVSIGEADLVDRTEKEITTGDILTGHLIRVKGIMDTVANTITEVKQIKDFSVPENPSPSPEAE
jgi:hypothetical protein